MEHAFNTNVANKYDVNIALLLQHFKYWTHNNLANKKNIHQGLCWTYNTVQAFCKTFHYWTRHQIEHLIKKAEILGLVVSGNHNSKKYDRTKWYALTPTAYKYFEELQHDDFLKTLYNSISKTKKAHESLSSLISENSEMDFGYFRNGFRKIPKPIPDTIPDTKPDIINGTSAEVLSEDYNLTNHQIASNYHYADYSNNQTQEEETETKSLENKINFNKSDYFETQTSAKNKQVGMKYNLSLEDLLEDNPFNLSEQLIKDWISNRRQKRLAITRSAWNVICKELTECQEQGINPIEAFEAMVASGWQRIKVDYFKHSTFSAPAKIQTSTQPPLVTTEENADFREYRHACQHNLPVSSTLTSKILTLKTKLKSIDKAVAREMLASIEKVEEHRDSKGFKNLVMASRNRMPANRPSLYAYVYQNDRR